MLKTAKIISAMVLSGLISSTAFAANDGDLGTSSTGNLQVSVNLPEVYRIGGLSDVALSVNSKSVTQNFCVYTNNTTGLYRLTVAGANGANGALAMTHGNNSIPYEVAVHNVQGGANGGIHLFHSGDAENFINASHAVGAIDCNDASDKTATMVISVTESALAVPQGLYTDTLTLTVAAQ